MRPHKIVSLATIVLIIFATLNETKVGINSSLLNFMFDSILTFIFPAITFFLSWIVSYEKKEEELTLREYYSYLFVNLVLPYILCMIPYIIYEYGISSVNILEVLKLFVLGNINKMFEYVKIIIELLALYPLIEYFVKSKTKITLILTFALGIISSVLHFETYIFTKVFSYLFFVALASFFSHNEKKAFALLRKVLNRLVFCTAVTLLLTFLTNWFKIYNFINPATQFLYSITAIFDLSYFLYRKSIYFYRDYNYLTYSRLFSPAIVGVSIFLLAGIILKVISDNFDFAAKISQETFLRNISCRFGFSHVFD